MAEPLLESVSILIPAIKKNVAFPDDLVKKLDGITLVQRAIDRSAELVSPDKIYLITDSEEIRLVAERNGIEAYWKPSLTWSQDHLEKDVYRFIRKGACEGDCIILLSPYSPLISAQQLKDACLHLQESGVDMLKPVRHENRILFDGQSTHFSNAIFGDEEETHNIEFKGFSIFRSDLFARKNHDMPVNVMPYNVGHDAIDITTYQDWWICEKLLRRRRIVFRVIGSNEVGMGHIYRALSLAHEITDHEILFISDTDNGVAVNQLAGYDYWLGIYEPEELVEELIKLKPDLVVNDILSTDIAYIRRLKENNIKVVNFEDLGSGASYSDLTINELYDQPQIQGDNIVWGHEYFFVRDEFNDAKPNVFRNTIDCILIAFGGTDQHNLSAKIYREIREYCSDKGIYIHIVTGPGYAAYDDLLAETASDANVALTHATGVMSHIMEQCQLAITSNGRTVYELAHMNIPSIVVAQHDRERMHHFSSDENGFVPLGTYRPGYTEPEVVSTLVRLVENAEYRRTLFDAASRYQFDKNKHRVARMIEALLSEEPPGNG